MKKSKMIGSLIMILSLVLFVSVPVFANTSVNKGRYD